MDLEWNYEISRVADFIRKHNFTRVALQFPDEVLKDSMMVVKALRRELKSGVKLYVMADTTYGSCCVDEVGAAHVNAQCVIHYGHTCLSPTSSLPALFIFGKASVSATNCARNLLHYGVESQKPVLVLFGLEYAHAIPEIKEIFACNIAKIRESTSMSEPLYADVSGSVMSPAEASTPANQLGLVDSHIVIESLAEGTNKRYKIGGLIWRLPEGHKVEDYLLFWIGLDNPAFVNVVLTFNSCEIGITKYIGDMKKNSFCVKRGNKRTKSVNDSKWKLYMELVVILQSANEIQKKVMNKNQFK
ncbi:hypothetical protein ACJIZ3_015970 [Penstemon smallii]|uniref:2-(3-amino-3-carboxypropyl)histidine synthase subunit 2 n=1 Tax=Penstemon smallii TaxID=265156 RepID=A0ABD3RRD5_9LAMI